jgi:uncharacterized protein (TIGR00369 family)
MNDQTAAGGLTVERLQTNLDRIFSPWVRELDLTVIDANGGHVTLIMQPGERLNRQGGIVSGQALMAAADTAMVVAIWSACGEVIPGATVDMNTSFLKPATNVELTLAADVIRRGRSIVFARAEITSSRDDKLVATATGTYALPSPIEQH